MMASKKSQTGGRILLAASALVLLLAIAAWWFFPQPRVLSLRFEPRDSGPFSYEDYAAVLERHVDDRGMVHYEGIHGERRRLDSFAAGLGSLDRRVYESWESGAKIAFWINAYNALTIEAILAHYPIHASPRTSLLHPRNSIRQIPGVWDRLQFRVMDTDMTLDHIEHQILRKEFDEPGIHVALVCAAVGCPPLRNEPYSGERLGEQLADQARRFTADPSKFRIDRAGGRVYLSSIFKWYGEDFIRRHGGEDFAGHTASERAVLAYVALHIEPHDREFLLRTAFSIEYQDYDWSLNERREIP